MQWNRPRRSTHQRLTASRYSYFLLFSRFCLQIFCRLLALLFPTFVILRQVSRTEGGKRSGTRVEAREAASGRKYGVDRAFGVTAATAAVAGHRCRRQSALSESKREKNQEGSAVTYISGRIGWVLRASLVCRSWWVYSRSPFPQLPCELSADTEKLSTRQTPGGEMLVVEPSFYAEPWKHRDEYDIGAVLVRFERSKA